jgi:hypothetical protein
MTYPTAPTQSWFDPASFFILNPDSTLGPVWHDGDVVTPGVSLDLDQWAIFDTVNVEYGVVYAFDGWGFGQHWNTHHICRTYDGANPPPVTLQPNGKAKMWVPVNQPFKVAGGYQDVPSPKPYSAGKTFTGVFTAKVLQNETLIPGSNTSVTFTVVAPARTDRAEGFKSGTAYAWRWKDSTGYVLAHNEGYPDRTTVKQAALKVAGSDCPYFFVTA